MAISTSKQDRAYLNALAFALNKLQQVVVGGDGYHMDLTQTTSGDPLSLSSLAVTTLTVNAPAATNSKTTIAMANNILGVFAMHVLDDGAHKMKDVVNDPFLDGYQTDGYTGVLATDTTSVVNLLNGLAVLFEAHQTQTGVHVHNDGTNYGLVLATDLPSAETLANALATALNTHMANAGVTTNTPRVRITAL